jgi:MFS family permease
MTAVCGLANSFAQLFFARVGVGVGEATMSPGALSMLTDYFPPERRPLAVSVYVAGGSLGSGLALIAGGTVIQHFTRLGHVTLPFLGTLEPWQCVFVMIGITGLIAVLLLLTLCEPMRRGLGATGNEPPELRAFLAFLRQRRRLFLCHFSGFALFSTLCYGLLAWAPTFFIRHHRWGTARVGLWFGLMIMICGVFGVICGGAWATRARQRGVGDATLRTAIWGVAAIVLPATFAPLAGEASVSLVLYGIATIFVAFPSGVSATALQEVTPNRLRAQVSALYYFAINLVGLGLGPLSVALLTDYVFRSEAALGYSLAVCAAVLGPAGALLMMAALRPFRAALHAQTVLR